MKVTIFLVRKESFRDSLFQKRVGIQNAKEWTISKISKMYNFLVMCVRPHGKALMV